MDEHQILAQITTLVDQEHQLRTKVQDGSLTSDEEHAELPHSKVRWTNAGICSGSGGRSGSSGRTRRRRAAPGGTGGEVPAVVRQHGLPGAQLRLDGAAVIPTWVKCSSSRSCSLCGGVDVVLRNRVLADLVVRHRAGRRRVGSG